MNKVQENFLKNLGLELDQEFELNIDGDTKRYKFILENEIFLIRQQRDGDWNVCDCDDDTILFILNFPERIKPLQKPILTAKEKRYLEAVLKPFKGEVSCICLSSGSEKYGNIYVNINSGDLIFPCFELGTMYKKMETDKQYTLEELGLFEERI